MRSTRPLLELVVFCRREKPIGLPETSIARRRATIPWPKGVLFTAVLGNWTRDDERSERAGGRQFVGAAEIGDDPLAHGGAFALVLDDLHVAARARLFPKTIGPT